MDIPRAPVRPWRRYLVGGGAIILITVGTAAVAWLEPAAPTVDQSSIWSDSVRRGELHRQIRGPGTLVAENSRLVTTTVGGLVERVLVENGATVTAGTVLVELRNPDIEREAVDAERRLAELESEAVMEEVRQEQQRMEMEATLEDVRVAYREAERLAAIDEELLASNIVSPAAAERSRERAEEALRRLELQENRFELQARNMEAQRLVNESSARGQREAAELSRSRLEALRIVAGADGVIQDIALQIGQNVAASSTIGRVTEPGRLKAVLRIPEVQAREVVVGQSAWIDTRAGVIPGRVSRIDPSAQGGAVTVDVALEGELPRGVVPDLNVDGTIETERMGEVLHVSRPVFAEAGRMVRLFRIDPGGSSASRVDVQLGRTSVNAVEILGGLAEGDVVILSDMSRWTEYERVRLR